MEKKEVKPLKYACSKCRTVLAVLPPEEKFTPTKTTKVEGSSWSANITYFLCESC